MRRSFAGLMLGLFLIGCQKPVPVPSEADAPGTPSPTQVGKLPFPKSAAPSADRGKASREGAAPQPRPEQSASERYAERTRQFLTAAEKGQISLLIELLGKGVNVNDKDDLGETALHKASAKGQRSAVVVLLMQGADLAGKDAQGCTPAMRAAEEGHTEVLMLLNTPGEAITQAGSLLKTVSAEAAKALGGEALGAITGRLTSNQIATRQSTDKLGQTALMKAAAKGNVECVKLFMNGEYDLNTRDKQGRSALMLAAQSGHAEIIDVLIEKALRWTGYRSPPACLISVAAIQQADRDGKTALELADAGGHKATARAVRGGVLQIATREGNLGVVRKTLDAKVDADLPLDRVLVAAAQVGSTEVVRYIMERCKDKSDEDKLRLMGAFVPAGNNFTNSGPTIFWAISGNFRRTAEALLDLAWWKDKAVLADYLNRPGFVGMTPLKYAEWGGGQPEMVQLMQKKMEEVKPSKK